MDYRSNIVMRSSILNSDRLGKRTRDQIKIRNTERVAQNLDQVTATITPQTVSGH